MESLETLQTISLAVQTLREIENLLINDDVKEQLINKVLEAIDIEIQKPRTRKHTLGSRDKIIESLLKLGGSATRAEIASDTALDPNVVSSLLNKLCKMEKLEKIPLEQPAHRNGRGLEPGYIYKLVEKGNQED